MSTVLLATYQLMPDGEPGGDLIAPLAARGIDARWVRWDDPDVDWATADLVAGRCTWDYSRRHEEFLAWARGTEQETRLLNGSDLFAWNSDKAYLVELADHVPVVPTELLDDADLVERTADSLTRWGTVVIKPRVGAGGVGVIVVDHPTDPRLAGLLPAPWIVQPLVDTVRTDGERSVYVFAGSAVSQVDKVPAADEIRVHDRYGGISRAVPLDPDLAATAESAVAAAEAVTGAPPAYARVDLMWWQGRWAVSELELIEPGLYLAIDPGNAERFADLVAAELDRDAEVADEGVPEVAFDDGFDDED